MRIDTSIKFSDFQKHCNLPNNRRILFSGAYGTGKTTFLNEYFEGNHNYQVVKLYPVNYAMNDNKDIFELMKYDILIQLLQLDVPINQNDLEQSCIWLKKGSQFALPIIGDIVGAMPVIGRNLQSGLNAVEKLIKVGREIQAEHPKAKALEFINSMVENTGNCYEMNDISLLISILINRIKEKGRQTVLLIDDFDRLEPMQSFRLLNILSCHNEHDNNNANKFDFDKIIVVCDVNNLRVCFAHLNGTPRAFSGYIDKFYSTHIYYFSIQKEVSAIVNSVLGTMDIRTYEQDCIVQVFSPIFKVLIDNNYLTVRNLLRVERATYPHQFYNRYSDSRGTDFIALFFGIMSMFYATNEDLKWVMRQCKDQGICVEHVISKPNRHDIASLLVCQLGQGQLDKEYITLEFDASIYKFDASESIDHRIWRIAKDSPNKFSQHNFPFFLFAFQLVDKYLPE